MGGNLIKQGHQWFVVDNHGVDLIVFCEHGKVSKTGLIFKEKPLSFVYLYVSINAWTHASMHIYAHAHTIY